MVDVQMKLQEYNPLQIRLKARLFRAVLGITGLLIAVVTTAAGAAEKVTVRYTPIEQSISVKELRTFADTGEQSSTISTVLEQTKADPANIRKLLNTSVNLKQYDIDVVLVERLLNSFAIEIFLQEFVKAVRPLRTEEGSLQAFRSAVVNSVADDNKISAIEFLEKYPTELLIEGNDIGRISARILKDFKDLQAPLARVFRKLQTR
jgi:hypothetical protein